MRKTILAVAMAAALGSMASGAAGAAQRSPTGDIEIHEREAILASGYTQLADYLRQLPAFHPLDDRRVSGDIGGIRRASVHSLGTAPTIILLDGQLLPTAVFGVTDLGQVPLVAIERVEILRGAAATRIAGSAAVAAINIVTRATAEGLEARSQYGEFDEGDGAREHHAFTLGSSSERASVVLGASYDQEDAVSAGARDISSVPVAGFPADNVNVGASSSGPFGRYGIPGMPGTLTLIPGRPGTSPEDFRPFDPATDGYNFAPARDLLGAQERTHVFARARYAVTDGIAAHASVLYAEQRAQTQFAAAPLLAGVVLGNGITVSADNVYNPFGTTVTRLQFRPTAFPSIVNDEIDTLQVDLGFTGEFGWGDRAWHWRAGYTHGDREAVQAGQVYDLAQLAAGLGPSFLDGNGVARCGIAPIAIAGCVPLNVFGGPDGFTAEMYDFLATDAQWQRTQSRESWHAGIGSGEWFALPAGDVAFDLSVERRDLRERETADALVQSGGTNDSPQTTASGGYRADEANLTFTVPLLRDVPGALALDATLGARHVDLDERGSDTLPYAAFAWQPFEQWRVAASWREGQREPAIVELFDSAIDQFPSFVDPCDSTGGADAATIARCRAGFAGLPPVPEAYQGTGIARAVRSGNAELRPEGVRETRAGVRWEPARFAIGLDWYRLEVDDVIGIRTLQAVLDDCYRGAQVSWCRFLQRTPTGDLESGFTGYHNTPLVSRVEGVELDAAWHADTVFGRFDVAAQANYVTEASQTDDRPGGAPEFDALGQRGGVPRVRAVLQAGWQHGDFGARVRWRHTSPLDEDCVAAALADVIDTSADALCSGRDRIVPLGYDVDGDGVPDDLVQPRNRLGSVTYTDLRFTWQAPWQAEIALGIDNALDRDPPVSRALIPGSFGAEYDPPGRFWYVSYAQRF